MKVDMTRLHVVFFAILILFLPKDIYAQSHGLIFSSYEAVQEKRTSLDLGAGEPLCLENGGKLSFDLLFIPNNITYFGYIFRLINNHNQNIDLVYDEGKNVFNVIAGDALTGLTLNINKEALFNKWVNLGLEWRTDALSFYMDGRLVKKIKTDLKDDCFRIVFGACNLHDFRTTDLPPMQLANIRVAADGRLKYFWPLSESKGNTSVDSIKGKKASVVNATWAKPLHAQWQLVQSLKLNGNASIAFDKAKEALYLVARDSVYLFSVKNHSVASTGLSSDAHHLLLGNQSVYHPKEQKLYNFYIDKQQMAAYLPQEKRWDSPFDTATVTQYWQANKFFSASQNALYILGGYGQLKYKNTILRHNYTDKSWDTIAATGEHFIPRYLSALGATTSGDTAYVLGGYGSMTGEQIVNPKYLYDLLLFDARNQSFKKLYSLREPKEPFVFASTMVLDEQNRSYYALSFPNDRFDSRLRMIKGSLESPGYTWVGDTIPYAFQDTRSFAELFYCPESKLLLAVTLLMDKERGKDTRVNIYSIAFPPNELPESPAEQEDHLPGWVVYLTGLALALGAIFLVRRARNRKLQKPVLAAAPKPLNRAPAYEPVAAPVNTTASEETGSLKITAPDRPAEIKAAVFLFGNFEVIDKEGQDITRLFTPLLKELFLLISIYTVRNGHGVSSEKLNELLWSDKSDKDAKNNRSVNMVKLKSILEKVCDCVIKKESGKWLLQYNREDMWIDLAELLHLIENRQGMNRETLLQVLHIIKKGAFLNQTDYAWLDDIKSDISNKVIDYLASGSTVVSFPADAELLIEIASGIFYFDQVNEQALKLKCRSLVVLGRHSLAKNAYEKFAREYRHMYGEEFPESFHDITAS
jgi:two-component SAPR family response regulator